MVKADLQEGRYRVLLVGVGNNTEQEKDFFCQNISKTYHVPPPQLRKIVDRCPVILKKNLSLRKAESIAKTFRSFGASIFVEEKKETLPISLEFQELTPQQLALESATPRRSNRATWSVTGRVKNISGEILKDTWVLIQLFEDFEEFIAFEEAPLPINPLPPEQTSPFRVIFDGDLPVKRISVAFKNASGQPLPAADGRKKRERAKKDIEDEGALSRGGTLLAVEEKPEAIGLAGLPEKVVKEEEKEVPGDVSGQPEQEVAPTGEEEIGEEKRGAARMPEEPPLLNLEPLESSPEPIHEELKEETDSTASSSATKELREEIKEALGAVELASDEEEGMAEKLHPDTSSIQSTAPLLLESVPEAAKEAEAEKAIPSFSWMGDFRIAVETFYQTSRDDFSIWFQECRKKGEFKDSLHELLTLLVHSRFDQGNRSVKALENTQRVFQLVVQPSLLPDQIPLLEGTSFASGEIWTDLFQRALPKIHQIGNAVLEKKNWNTLELERMIQVIPHMGRQNSRMAIRWVNELIPEVVEIDDANHPIDIGESLYRVAARLGVVDPQADFYQGRNSRGEAKIQSFAMAAFPHRPVRVERPMEWMGSGVDRGGHCFPVQPRCEGCLFNAFCPKLYLNFNPSEKGMLAEQG